MLETIKFNSTGDIVKVAQYLTKFTGIKKASGIFDASFESYVKAFQNDHNLVVDGVIGKNTWKVIANEALTCSTKKNKISIYTCALQILLGGLEIDGVYGEKTKKAVAAYQASANLSPDGICGSKTWAKLLIDEDTNSTIFVNSTDQSITNNKVLNNCVKYLQWDSKWKNVKYSTHTSNQTIGNSGCGPTSMAMIMATFIDSKITPIEMCALAVKQGYRTYNSGTSWDFFRYIFKSYDGFEKYIETSSVNILMTALREGALAVCSMNANDNNFFTKGGHFVVARGCDKNYIYFNDPNKKETPRKQAYNKTQSCLKQAFIFWPKSTFAKPEPKKIEEAILSENSISNTTQEHNLNGKIIDISKWQGTIDFDMLAPEVSLVIARASCGSDKDSKIDEYAEAMNKLNIPFGVYCYSYAGTTEKAQDEAKKLVSYAEKYKPLFYVLDAEEARMTEETIRAFITEIRKYTELPVGCYVAHHRYETYNYIKLQNLFDFTWIPCYGKNDGTVKGAIKPAYYCDLWQYTSAGKIAGIKGSIDLNIITGDGHNLKWFLGI